MGFPTMCEGDVAFKSSYLYELFSCINKKMTILSWRRIPLAVLLCEQFIHLTQITLCPNIQLFTPKQHANQLIFSYFLVVFRLQYCGILSEF